MSPAVPITTELLLHLCHTILHARVWVLVRCVLDGCADMYTSVSAQAWKQVTVYAAQSLLIRYSIHS